MYIFVFFYLIESMYFYLSLIQVKAFANGLCIWPIVYFLIKEPRPVDLGL
jgi:hypothetical protein